MRRLIRPRHCRKALTGTLSEGPSDRTEQRRVKGKYMFNQKGGGMPERLIVLTGPMRSGTTLLGDMLHAGVEGGYRHPGLAFAPDRVTNLRTLTSRIATELGLKRALMNRNLPRAFFSAWIQQAQQKEFWGQFRQNILANAPTPMEPAVIGVKNTSLLPELICLSRMKAIDAKFIIMFRDPRDCFASTLARYAKMYAQDPSVADGVHLSFMNVAFMLNYLALDRWLGALRHNVLFVSYERLVTEPEPTLRSVLSFIGVDSRSYDWDSIRQGRVIRNSSWRPIGVDDVEKDAGFVPSIGVHSVISQFHVGCIEELMSPIFKRFGYRRSTSMAYGDRQQAHGEFLEGVRAAAAVLGYALEGLDVAARGRPVHQVKKLAQIGRQWRAKAVRPVRRTVDAWLGLDAEKELSPKSW